MFRTSILTFTAHEQTQLYMFKSSFMHIRPHAFLPVNVYILIHRLGHYDSDDIFGCLEIAK